MATGIEELLADMGIEETGETTEEPAAPQVDDKTEVVPDSAVVPEDKEEGGEAPPAEPPTNVVPPETGKPEVDPREVEIRELRQLLRESKKEMMAMKVAVGKAQQKPQLNEDGEEIPPTPSRIEQLQSALANIGEQKSAILDILVETMEMSPKYEDVRQVCTKSNFDDIFESAALKVSRDSGKSFDEALLEVELSVWKMSNPYKYMYDVIKKHHPSYAVKPVAATPPAQAARKPVVAPASVSAIPGGDADTKSGWSAAKIDAMDVEDLDKVPKDIYEKYLMGTLK